MDARQRFWRSTGIATGGMLLLLLLWSVYEIFTVRTRMPRTEMFVSMLYALPWMLTFALPVGSFVGGFSTAPEALSSRGGRGGRSVAAGGLVLALGCLLILGYLSPLLRAAYQAPDPYLHQLPGAWKEALAEAYSRPPNSPMRWYDLGRVVWDLFYRLFWSVLVAIMAGVGLLTGYWARWSSDRRVVAIQAWAIALLLALAVVSGMILGRDFALQNGHGLIGAWQLLRVPVLVLCVLAWPTWHSVRNDRHRIAAATKAGA